MINSQPAHLLEAERGHRRGVVLGLTMAEIMLLLLFCMLLVSAALMEERDGQLAQAAALMEERNGQLARAQTRIDQLAALVPTQATEAESIRVQQDTAELEVLRQDRKKLVEALPSLAGMSPSTKVPDETWRELVMNQELGELVQNSNISLSEVIKELESRPVKKPENADPSGNDWPPIITLGDDEFRFLSNSAELSVEFQARLQTEIADQVAGLLRDYGVDVVEVVGHTDERPIASARPSTMDKFAIPVLNGGMPVTDLKAVDNAGLGLARAIAVSRALKEKLGLSGIQIIPLSAAQIVMIGDVVSDGLHPEDNKDRRRIEIRVRRSSSASPGG